jgi:hypothetical protein
MLPAQTTDSKIHAVVRVRREQREDELSDEDFVAYLMSAKRAIEEHLKSLGLKEDMSNAVCVGALGGTVFENENDCPLYLSRITEGYWVVKDDEGAADIVRVESGNPRQLRSLAGVEEGDSVAKEVAQGIRFISKIEIPAA